jgi:predicted PurR-regulated permease PerM
VSTIPPTPATAQAITMLRWLLVAVWVVLGWIVLSFLAGVLAPILAALGVAYLLDPVLDKMVHRRVNRTLGAVVLVTGAVAVIVTAIVTLAPRAADQLAEFARDLPRIIDTTSAWTQVHFGFALPSDWKAYVTPGRLGDPFVQGPLHDLATVAVGGIFHLLGLTAEALLVPVFTFYFLVDWHNLVRRIDHMVPPRNRSDVREITAEIDTVVAGWVRGQAIVTTLLAVLYAIGFTLAGMPLSLPVGLAVGALTVIPFVGTFVGASIAALVTLADGGSLQTLGMVAAVIACLHVLEAGFLTPKIVGHRVGLSETGALFAVVAGGKLLGFVGVVLAVPIAATCAVVARYALRFYEHTEFFGRESDANVEITPAMALIMPGVPLDSKVFAALQGRADDRGLEPDPAPPTPAPDPDPAP